MTKKTLSRDEMKPVNPHKVRLAELLDRALDKGLVLNADLLITVAGIPLLAANLRLVLASVETMLEYGMMHDWDEMARAQKSIGEKEEQVIHSKRL